MMVMFFSVMEYYLYGQQLVEELFQTLSEFLGTRGAAVVVDDVGRDGKELFQFNDITLVKILFLDSGEDAVTEMVLLLHGTPLAGKGTVGLGQHKG